MRLNVNGNDFEIADAKVRALAVIMDDGLRDAKGLNPRTVEGLKRSGYIDSKGLTDFGRPFAAAALEAVRRTRKQ
jgi:hypothetical protein